MQNARAIAEQNRNKGHAYNASNVGERHENLLRAIKYYEEALDFYTVDTFPDEWTKLQEDITNAYSELALGQAATLPPAIQRGTSSLPVRKRRTVLRLQWPVIILIVLVIVIPFTTVLAKNYISSDGPSCVAGTLYMDGSTALQPLLTVVALDYMKHCSTSTIVIGGGASKTGLAHVEQGSGTLTGVDKRLKKGVITNKAVPIQIGSSDIFALPTQSDLIDHQVAIGIFAVILNKDISNIHNLSTTQLQQIYTDASMQWSDICDGKLCGPQHPIFPISRTTNSGSRFTFEKYILGGVATVAGLGLHRNTAPTDAVTEVATTPYSIGYAPLYIAKKSNQVTILSIDGASPLQTRLVENNTYKFWNIEHMYTRGQPTPLAQSFINYMYSNFARQQVYQFNLLNIADIAPSMRASHQSEQA